MKIKNPYTTDTRLFFMAIKNILFSKKRGSWNTFFFYF
jgi:hypothetical protein